MKKIFDRLRNIWVEALPEEIVRQNILRHLIEDLGFPSRLIVVEKELLHLPHLTKKKIELVRRMDILCYTKDLHPLLLIECKAEDLTEEVFLQVIGYNQIVKASFLAIASKKGIKTYWQDPSLNSYSHVEFLPSYAELLKAANKNQMHV